MEFTGITRDIVSSRTATAGREIPRRETPPFRADHVGSLLRPPELTQDRAAWRAGEIDASTLEGVEDAAVRDVIALQREAGMQTVTDGEFRRSSWHMDFIYAPGGVEQVAGESTPPVPQRRR